MTPVIISPPELLVTLQLRFPNMDRQALAEHLADTMKAAVAAGGLSTAVSIQEHDPDEES